MCRPKPFPRCSDYAHKALYKAQQAYESDQNPQTETTLAKAKREYLLSPRGIAMLHKQGKHELADKMSIQRKRLTAEAVRFTKYSTTTAGKPERWMGDRQLRPILTSPTVSRAYALAVSAHENISRKSGEPYINHPLRVAKHLENMGYNDEVVSVALLHDAVEDSDMTVDDLRRHGFNERIVSGVDSVSKRAGETYPEAVERASEHPIGMVVKLSDNLDNSSEPQLRPFTPEKAEKQRRKYAPARKTLIASIWLSQRTRKYFNPKFGFTSRTYHIRLSEQERSLLTGA